MSKITENTKDDIDDMDSLLSLVRQLREEASKGFATCQSGNGNPKIVIEFRDLMECQDCYGTLVKLWGGYYTRPGKPNLAPCPFCGADGEISRGDKDPSMFSVYCSSCDAMIGMEFETEADAALAWNGRSRNGG